MLQLNNQREMRARDLQLWQRARPYLDVRGNDEHTLISYWIARAILRFHPEAREDVVLPAIIFHDVGWKSVPDDQRLLAIGPGAQRPDLVIVHEKEGVRITAEEFAKMPGHGLPLAELCAIIDGHDTTREARSIEDAILKDADKLWRHTPHGVATMQGWWGYSNDKILTILEDYVGPQLLTATGRAMAHGFLATARALDASPDLLKVTT